MCMADSWCDGNECCCFKVGLVIVAKFGLRLRLIARLSVCSSLRPVMPSRIVHPLLFVPLVDDGDVLWETRGR